VHLSSNAHTYRLLIFKEQAVQTALLHRANRFVRQQQRSEIMQRFAIFVNFFFASPQLSLWILPA
jgi:hypothetical protein